MRQAGCFLPISAIVFSAIVVIGCGGSSGSSTADGGQGGGDGSPVMCVSGLASLALSPENPVVALDGSDPAAPITFTATGRFGDNHTETLPASSLMWTVGRADDTPPGVIANGVLAPYPSAGGTVTVTATDGCVTGTTTVAFHMDVTIGTPMNPGDWTGVPVVGGAGAPDVVYPSDQTRFPRNIYRTLFQWHSAAAELRLIFDGPGAHVTVYTDGAHLLCDAAAPAAGCWEAGELAWQYIAGSNAGETVTWTVDALDSATTPPTIRRSATITLGFSRRDVSGAIFYWSTTSAGVRRANIAAAEPEDYITGKPGTTYTAPDDQVKCVACHVVSRDGKYMAAPVGADSGNSLWIMEVTPDAPPTPLVKQIANTGGHGFATISPDNAYVVAAWGGAMWSLDRATGAYLGDLPLGALEGTHPDWRPDGSELVFATGKGDAPGDADLALIDYTAGTWGTPSVLVAAAGGLSNLFPMFSPDGQWIAFSRGKGGHGDLQAQLFVVAEAGGAPIELINANRVVSNQLGDGQTQNSQPTWAPPGDLDWVAFNSQREYGVVSPGGTQQIWVAAVDTDAAISGDDPSFPAFRLQFQGLEENNHRAYWTLDVRDPPPPGPDAGPPPDSGMCVVAGGTCDPVTDVCCDSGYVCDTQDNGLTYTCFMPPVP